MEPETETVAPRSTAAAEIEPEARPFRMLEVRAPDDAGSGTVEFIAQYYGTVNDWNERFEDGCFDKSVQERVPKRRVRMTDGHRWSCESTLGTVVEATTKPGLGLWMKGEFSAVKDAQNVRQKIKEGHVSDVSIEFRPINAGRELVDGVSVMVIREAALFGVSFLPYSSQDIPAVLSVRSSAGGYQALPVAPLDTPWKPNKASKRVTAWATGDGPAYGLNWARFERAFVLRARRGELTGYQLQVADLVDVGQGPRLMVVPAAVRAAAAALLEQRGTTPPADYAAAQGHLDRYFERIRTELSAPDFRAPWAFGSIDALLADVATTGQVAPARVQEAEEATLRLIRALPVERRGALLEGLSAGPATAPPTTTSGDSCAERMARLRNLELQLDLEEPS